MTASLITAAELARQAIRCFLTHCAIEEDETTFHAYYKARIADKALAEAFKDLERDHGWVIRELQHRIDKKRMRTSMAQIENNLEALKLQVQAKDNEIEITNSLLLERQREIDKLNDLVEGLRIDLGMMDYQDTAQDMVGKSIAEIADVSRGIGESIDVAKDLQP